MADKEKDKFQIETAFKEIEGIISKLESEDTNLKDSIELYGKGAKLINECKDELSDVEKEMIVITESLKNQ